MIDLEDLSEALRNHPGDKPPNLDLTHILFAGRRMRRRRRLHVAVISMVSATVILTAAVTLHQANDQVQIENATTPSSPQTSAPAHPSCAVKRVNQVPCPSGTPASPNQRPAGGAPNGLSPPTKGVSAVACVVNCPSQTG